MARTKQTARAQQSVKAPKKQLASKFARKAVAIGGSAPLIESASSADDAASSSYQPSRMDVKRKKIPAKLAAKLAASDSNTAPSRLTRAPTLPLAAVASTSNGDAPPLAKRQSAAKALSFVKQITSPLKKPASLPNTSSGSAEAVAMRPSLQKKSTTGKVTSVSKSKTTASLAQPSTSRPLTKSLSTTKKPPSLVKLPSQNVAVPQKRKITTKVEAKAKKPKVEKKSPKPSKASGDCPHKTKKEEALEANPIHFLRGEYVAVRNEEGGYYICRLCQNIYEKTKKVKVYWLNEKPDEADVYTFEYVEWLGSDYSCIICYIKMKKHGRNEMRLPADQKLKVERFLQKAKDREQGLPVSDTDESEGDTEAVEDSEEEMELKIDETPTKEDAKTTPTKPKSKAASKNVKKSSPKAKKETPKKKTPEKPPLKKLTSAERRNPNLLLKARGSVVVSHRDPLMDTTDKMAFVSTAAYSKLVLRAVNLADTKMLQKLINDSQHVSTLTPIHSVGMYIDTLQLAVKRRDAASLRMLVAELSKDQSKAKPRAEGTRSMIHASGTGSYNYRSLGIANIRKLSMSRGSREGNNALLKDSGHDSGFVSYTTLRRVVKYAMKSGVSNEFLSQIYSIFDKPTEKSEAYDKIWLAVRYGHRKLAGELMKEMKKVNAFGAQNFNVLHESVLLNDDEDLPVVRAMSVKKKPYDNDNITPLHCAAINPNAKYLTTLLNVVPEYGILDAKQRRPIHFAATCEGPGPLEFLIKRGIDFNDADNQGYTPLHIACECGRAQNVEAILRKATQDIEDVNSAAGDAGDGDDDESGGGSSIRHVDRYGVGGINRPVSKPQNRSHYSYAPLHIAVENGHKDVVQVLLRYGADVHRELGPSRDKKTPLMVAAYSGDLDIVKLLIGHDARVEQKDKLKKTALIHAVMSGHTHIASYLISLGASANVADTSGNTVVHYAAAYGWYFTLKLLLDTGANPNIANDWKTTPAAIAFLKGHMGLADMLLAHPGADINFKDESGMTLLGTACCSPITPQLVDQVKYLISKGADCSIKDTEERSPLHHIAANPVDRENADSHLLIAKLLIDSGCNVNDVDSEKRSALMFAVEKSNTTLVKLLIEEGSLVSTELDNERRNILHIMATQCMTNQHTDMLKLFSKTTPKKDLALMVAQVDKEGFTPLLRACQAYCTWDGHIAQDSQPSKEANADSDSEGEDEVDEDEDVDEDEEGSGDEEDMDEGSEDGGDDDDDDDDYTPKKSPKKKSPKKSEVIERKEKKPEEEEEKTDAQKYMEALTEEQKKRNAQSEEGRAFIRALVTLGASMNEAVAQKYYSKNDVIPDKERDRYHAQYGKFTPLNFMMSTTHVAAVVTGDIVDHMPGLTMVLSYKVNVNCVNLKDRTPLLTAVRDGRFDLVKILVEHGADVNCEEIQEKFTASPLTMAIHNRRYDIAEYLLTKEADITYSCEKTEWTCLHYAARMRGAEAIRMLKLLLDRGADPNWGDKLNRTSLHVAVNANSGSSDASAEVEAFLIENGADVYMPDDRKRLPLHYVFVKMGRHKDTSAIDPIELCTTLTSVMETNGLDELDEFQHTPLHLAARRGASVCCMHLISKGAAMDRPDGDGNSAMALAALCKHESCCMMLLQKGASVNTKIRIRAEPPAEHKPGHKPAWTFNPLGKRQQSNDREYPLFQTVVYNGWQGLTFMLLDALKEHGMRYTEAIEAALTVHKYNLALTFIRKQRHVAELSMTNSDGRNLWHVLVLTADNQSDLQTRIAELLLEKGVDPLVQDNNGATALLYACVMQVSCLGQYILEHYKNKVDLEATDVYGRTALAACFWKIGRNTNLFVKLLELGANPNVLCDYPPVSPMMFGNLPSEDYFQRSTAAKVTPLILAICTKSFYTAQNLIEFGADINKPDENGVTPLMYAVKYNDVHVLKLLLDTNYDMNEQLKAEAEEKRREEEESRKKLALTRKPSRRQFGLGLGLFARNMSVTSESGAEEPEEEEKMETEEQTEEELGEHEAFEKLPTFRLASDVNLRARDSQGWSVLHHLVSPLDFGTYDSLAMLRILYDVGGKQLLKIQDKAGLTAVDYSLIKGAPRLSRALQKLLDIDEDKWERPMYCGTVLNDGIKWPATLPTHDHNADAQRLLKRLEAEDGGEVEEEFTYTPQPDDQLNLDKGTGEVVLDAELKVHYDVLLTKIDVSAGTWGLYNFYKMQVVYQKGKDLYILLNRWGRIGDVGQFQRTPFPNKEDAVKEFCKVFRAKTGNKWEKIKSFEAKEKKYRLVDADKRMRGKKMRKVTFDLTSNHKSLLPRYVQDLVKEMVDVTSLEKTVHQAGIDTSVLPFGRIKRETLEKAKATLNLLKEEIERVEKLNEERRKPTSTVSLADLSKHYQECARLTSEFLYLVPQHGYEYEKVRPIVDMESLKQQYTNLNTLLEVEMASKVLAGAQYRAKEMNPLDYVYRSLGCSLELMEEQSSETQYLLKYISNTFNGKVEALFRVAREGEEQRLQKCEVDNHMLLFHGSSTYNLISILGQGLLVAPPFVPITGHLFGRGIYFADAFSKSAGYCHNWSHNSDTKFMLVCQVALGEQHTALQWGDSDLPPEGKHSTIAASSTMCDPALNVTVPSGAVLPLGRMVKRPDLAPDPKTGQRRWYSVYQNEYIVFDAAQVCIRYIVQFKQ